MTADKYLRLCEQLGKEPDPQEMPPDINDFPSDVRAAIVLFSKLGDHIAADVGYLGKDYTLLDRFLKIYNIQNEELFLETLLRLDSKIKEKSQAEMKAARDKLKQKSKAA